MRRLVQCRVALTDVRNDRTITEIGMKWGFSDAAHFSRSVKAAFGISPSAFRRAKTSPSGDVNSSPDAEPLPFRFDNLVHM